MVTIIFFGVHSQDTNKHILFLPPRNLKLRQSHTLQSRKRDGLVIYGDGFLSATARRATSRSLTVKINPGVNPKRRWHHQAGSDFLPLTFSVFAQSGVCLHRQQSACSMRERQTRTLDVWRSTLHCCYYMLAMQTVTAQQTRQLLMTHPSKLQPISVWPAGW